MAPLVDPEQVTAVGGEPTEIDISAWATDDRTEALTFIVEPVSAREGRLDEVDEGRVVYTGPSGYAGADSFEFTVRDEHGEETTATAHVDVLLGGLGGDFNVAVAEFSAAGPDQAAASSLSQSLHEQVESSLESRTEVNIEVASPGDVGPVLGETAEARAEAAAELADQIPADVVVFGTLDAGDGESTLSAEFYLSDRGLTRAEELAGVYPLDSLRLGTSDPLALTRAASQLLEPKITALSQLAIGLSHYQLGEYPEAESLFLEAADSWPRNPGDTNGLEVVFTLLGNVSGLRNEIDAADRFYAQALELDPDYARARFGAAEVQFQRSKGTVCFGTGAADLDELDGALARFEELLELPAPELAFLPERARVEIGRINLCLTSNGVERREEARDVLQAVISDIGDKPRLRDLAADAHASLGDYHLLNKDFESAADEYTIAVDTTLDLNRKRGFYMSLAWVHLCRLDQPELAESYRQQAESLPGAPLTALACTGQ
jgi:tetratricopeptide (TPR) repeat protein